MNTLSWLLILGDVSENLFVVIVMICAALAVVTVIRAIHANDTYYGDEKQSVFASCKRTAKFIVALALVSCLLPSKQTAYLIAASQMGEKALTSETGNKAVSALNRYLDSIGKPANND